MTGTSISTGVLVLAAAAAGAAAGLAYFAALRRTADLIGAGARGPWPLVLTLGRVALAVGLFAAAAGLGAGPLLGAFAGFLAARAGVLCRARRSG
jgi:hypothetical protein